MKEWGKLSSMFRMDHRFNNFGMVLSSIEVKGFRGIKDLNVSFDSPITAFSGSNGSGKSTLLQLAACSYKIAEGTKSRIAGKIMKRYYLYDFFRRGTYDRPFEDDSFVKFNYLTNGEDKNVEVRRGKARWSKTYQNQPDRHVYYVGFTLYIPGVERRDLSVYMANKVKTNSIRNPNEQVIKGMRNILGIAYNEIRFASVSYDNKNAEIGLLQRASNEYSESNMGFGEGRVLYLVNLMENAPDKSLFILEEPETSLHSIAQKNLGHYLLDVVIRKKHQVIISTHSVDLLSTLPIESCKCLMRQDSELILINNASPNFVKAILSGNKEVALTIIVEDIAAKILLTEIIRKVNPKLASVVEVIYVGSDDEVSKKLVWMREKLSLSRNVIGVRDGNASTSHIQGMFNLPGSEAPEVELLTNNEVRKNLFELYQITSEDIDEIMSDYAEHRNWFDKLQRRINLSGENSLLIQSAQIYAKSLYDSNPDTILKFVEDIEKYTETRIPIS